VNGVGIAANLNRAAGNEKPAFCLCSRQDRPKGSRGLFGMHAESVPAKTLRPAVPNRAFPDHCLRAAAA
jgi:hypothetical protein